MCLINHRSLLSSSAVIRSWYIYELQKSTTIAFSKNSLYSIYSIYSIYSRNPTCEIPPCLRISNRKYPPPPFLRNSSSKNPSPPFPFGNPKSRPWYRCIWIFSGIAHCTTQVLKVHRSDPMEPLSMM